MDTLAAVASSDQEAHSSQDAPAPPPEPFGAAAAANNENPVAEPAVEASNDAPPAPGQQDSGAASAGPPFASPGLNGHDKRGDDQQLILELPDGLPGLGEPQVGPRYKRGRGRSFFKEQPKKGAVCQVPGCDRSLHKLRDYYKRYKICPYHLELPCLVVEGQTIRFCQQCGRFQLLTDFEGDRRSCRRKLDKHNERRRKAEAEQKARLMGHDSDSDSPGSTRGNKAQRVSPYRGGGAPSSTGKGYGSLAGAAGGLGELPADLTHRLQSLVAEPGLRDGLPPGLLEQLSDPGLANIDWLAAGSLTTMASGGLPPMPPPMGLPPQQQQQQQQMLPPDLMALLPAEVQQQVAQQGMGVLSNALVAQLQQLDQSAGTLPPVAPRAFGFSNGGLYGTPQALAAPPPVPAYAASHSAPSMLAPALQQQLQLRQRDIGPGGLGIDGASVFLPQLAQQAQQAQQRQLQQVQQALPQITQQMQQVQQAMPQQMQQRQQVQQAVPQMTQQRQQVHQAVPLLRSEPARSEPAQPAVSRSAPDPNNKAALLLALAKQMGVSSQELASALAEGGVGGGANGDVAPQAAAAAPPLLREAPLPSPQRVQPMAPVPAAASATVPLSSLLNDGGGSGHQDGTRPGSRAAAAAHQPQMGQHTAPMFHSGPNLSATGSHAAQLPLGGASPAGPAPAPAQVPLDLEQLHSAVQNGGLNPGIANDANLLLQLVAAVEAAQQEAGPGKERMHSLSLKLFNCTPDRLPGNIIDQLESWLALNKSVLDGASRPGCVHLSVSALMSGQEFATLSESFAGLVQRLALGGLPGVQTSILARLDGRATLLDARKEQLLQLDVGASVAAAPDLHSVRPLAVTPRYTGPILVTGRNIGGPRDTMYCRVGDRYPTTEVLGRGTLMQCPQAGDKDWVMLHVPALQEGCIQLEAQRGMFVSAPHSLLVLEDEEAVGELRQLETAPADPAAVAELLHRLGAVLRCGRTLRTPGGGSGIGAELLARLASTAQELAATCLLRGWTCVLRHVLPVASAGCSPAAALAGIEAHLGGMPVLHAAALTAGPKAIRELGSWAAKLGHRLCLSASWGGGLTALHVATLLREPEEVSLALTELYPEDAPAVWAAASARHGGDTPLSLACRLNKRALLGTLCSHGVPAAGAMLAALQLQDELDAAAGTEAAAEVVVPLPPGVEGRAEELSHQHRRWTEVYGRMLAERVLSEEQAKGKLRSWPSGSAKHRALPGRHTNASAPDLAAAAAAAVADKPAPGSESPSSVLCAAGKRRSESMSPRAEADGSEVCGAPTRAARPLQALATGVCGSGLAAEAAEDASPSTPTATFHQPFKAQSDLLDSAHASGSGMKSLEGCGGVHRKAGCQAGGAMASADTSTFHQWHATKLARMEGVAFALVTVLVCSTLLLAPASARDQLHAWLLSAVGRAPLMLQPLLLLCQPARRAYLRCSDSALVLLHVAMFGVQYLVVHSRGADWIAANPVLLSYPAGLWLLIAVFTLQLRFAVQVPALLLTYVANLTLLPSACRVGKISSTTSGVPACVAFSGMRMFGLVVVLPLVSAWLVESRARSVYASMHAAQTDAS